MSREQMEELLAMYRIQSFKCMQDITDELERLGLKLSDVAQAQKIAFQLLNLVRDCGLEKEV